MHIENSESKARNLFQLESITFVISHLMEIFKLIARISADRGALGEGSGVSHGANESYLKDFPRKAGLERGSSPPQGLCGQSVVQGEIKMSCQEHGHRDTIYVVRRHGVPGFENL